MEIMTTLWQPSTLPAVCVSVSREPVTGHAAAWTTPTFGPARLRALGDYRISGSTDGTMPDAGKDIPVMNAQLMGDVRGVPPRGRPV